MEDMNCTYWHDVNGNLVKLFFPFNSVISGVGGIFKGSGVMPTTAFDDDCDKAIIITEGNDLVFLTTDWWEVVDGENVSIYYVEGVAVIQSPNPFILRPVGWPEKKGWVFRVGFEEGKSTGWEKNII